MLGIPFLYKSGIEFLINGTAAQSWLNGTSMTNGWYYEAGIGIGKIFDLIRADVTYRLSNPKELFFTIGISSVLWSDLRSETSIASLFWTLTCYIIRDTCNKKANPSLSRLLNRKSQIHNSQLSCAPNEIRTRVPGLKSHPVPKFRWIRNKFGLGTTKKLPKC